jgi:hypothetical protein
MLTRTTYRLALAVFVILCTFCTSISYAQYTNYREPFEDLHGSSTFGFQLGATTFLGDLGGNQGSGAPLLKDFNSKTVCPLFGVSYSYFPQSWLSVKAGLNYTWINGADSLISISNQIGHAAGRYSRNLSFKSTIAELSAETEWYPLQMLWQYQEPKLRPFVGAGIGIFHFNPKAQLNGDLFELHPLHLEGQGFPEYPDRKNYKLTQVYIPLSFGLKYRVNDFYFVSLSTTLRKTFTDYIDDVSTTYIDPKLFDKYLSPDHAKLAKQLYYRGLNSQMLKPGQYRGYDNLDSYTSIFISLTYIFGNKPTFNRP